jgi:hypothetical protein
MQDMGRVIISASYHFLERAQFANVIMAGAITDPKGARSKAPSHQADPDVFLAWIAIGRWWVPSDPMLRD